MISPLKELLKGAVSRARIGRQVDAVEILAFTNDFLYRIMPKDHRKDAKGVSYKEGVLSIHVLNSSARHFLNNHEVDLFGKLRDQFPNHEFLKLSFRVSKSFPTSEL